METIKSMDSQEFWVPSIKDSGARTEFSTGAVRDIQEGKGRCDLMPLDVVAGVYNHVRLLEDPIHNALLDVAKFVNTGDQTWLTDALFCFG
ncbi:MAG: hypothetical protein IKY91_08890, partial [Akkermansia sp.]|nr:hypothetical protein [Akkermansia sp.]